MKAKPKNGTTPSQAKFKRNSADFRGFVAVAGKTGDDKTHLWTIMMRSADQTERLFKQLLGDVGTHHSIPLLCNCFFDAGLLFQGRE